MLKDGIQLLFQTPAYDIGDAGVNISGGHLLTIWSGLIQRPHICLILNIQITQIDDNLQVGRIMQRRLKVGKIGRRWIYIYYQCAENNLNGLP